MATPNLLQERLGALEKGAVLGYGRRVIPSDVDDQISALVLDYQALERTDREAVSNALAQWQSSTFLCYAERMAALAVRRRAPDLLWGSLVAIAMDGARFDPRENLIALALVNHSATKIGLASGELLQRAAEFAGESVAKLISSFDARPVSGKAIEQMGFRETYLGGDFSYQYVEAEGLPPPR